ncbi:Zinc finger BED domain-containing protein 5 [Araneus ventricosus]|uniref:Zinc finger BED domain-containing protein 5 n=1 Tax=Araneus ventricosus TaxID=182803 RepID=A0A4Y2RGM4_ARAVE|nr:Zinc finger BED domain-containing protein 5 [Araneus ventricosus]
MDKWLKTGTLKKSVSRTGIRTTNLAAMGINVDQQDDNYEVQRQTDWPVQIVENLCLAVKGFRGRIKTVASHVTWSHCCIHSQSLAAKPLPDPLKEVLNQSFKVVNFIKANSTNTRLFKSLCGDMGVTTLLLHTEAIWLSRGNILTRLFEPRHEVLMFFEDHPFSLRSKFYESEWLQHLAYLSDIFSEINLI